MRRRKKLLLYFIVVSIILLLLLIVTARFVGTKGLIVKEYSINGNIPSSFNGLKIVHISDIHYGRTTFEREFEALVDKVNMLNPDIVVFTGDILDDKIDNSIDDKNTIIKYFKLINAKLGKYLVSGNHDFENEYFYDIASNSDFKYLDNNFELIYYEGYEPIVIAGVTTAFDGVDINDKLSDYGKYIEENDIKYKILLAHEPDIVDHLEYDFDLILSGHSHNGQVRLPLVGVVWLPEMSKKYYDEHYVVNSSELYISSGVGTSFLPLRLFNKPSINFYRIVSSNK